MCEPPMDEQRQPRYSGPNRTGICICGHSWEAHHLGLVMRQEYIDQTHEGYIPQECCAFGHNEAGGMMWDVDGEYLIEHCFSYRDEKDTDA